MLKRISVTLLAAFLLVLCLAPAAVAAEETSGTWGEFTWKYDNHTLTISGIGDMEAGQPWATFKDKIETVIFTGGVTKVGDGAFENYDALETIDFGDSMREIGKRAFYDCNDIVEIRLPESFRTFGEECFRNCGQLKRVICEGGIMPSFKSACMHTGNFISVFYPPNSPWAWEYTNTVMAAYGGMVSFFMASEDIMENGYTETESAEETLAAEDVTEATEAMVLIAEDVTEATTEPTVPETTVPETTVPETEPTTVPTTESTEAATEPTELTLFDEPTEGTEPAKSAGSILNSRSWIGLLMVVGVITFLIAGAMIVRGSRRDRY